MIHERWERWEGAAEINQVLGLACAFLRRVPPTARIRSNGRKQNDQHPPSIRKVANTGGILHLLSSVASPSASHASDRAVQDQRTQVAFASALAPTSRSSFLLLSGATARRVGGVAVIGSSHG